MSGVGEGCSEIGGKGFFLGRVTVNHQFWGLGSNFWGRYGVGEGRDVGMWGCGGKVGVGLGEVG